MPPDRRPIDWAPDEFDHEISTCINVKGRGLILLTSCGHRGAVNSLKQAIAASGVRKVHAVVGGFHLAPHQIVGLGIAHVPEGRRLCPKMTVLENLRMGAYLRTSKTDTAVTLGMIYQHFPILQERGPTSSRWSGPCFSPSCTACS